MDYKHFTAKLGDFVMGVQILSDNLERICGSKEDSLAGFASALLSRGWSAKETALLTKLDADAQFFFHEVAKTFMDLDDFAESAPFADANGRLDKARETLYRVNALAFAKSTRQ